MMPSGATIGMMHTYRDLHMIPKSKITFAPPTPKFEIQEIQGTSGELDYTSSLTGEVHYNSRIGELSFLVLSGDDYLASYSAIKSVFDGSNVLCILDDDPDFHYEGRFYLSEWRSEEKFSECKIRYILKPYRYSEDDISLYDWQWDDLEFASDDLILYHSFTVEGIKTRSLVNMSTSPIMPEFICSAPMTVTIGSAVYQLTAGTTKAPGFYLEPGVTVAEFQGTGTVSMSYPMEVLP